MVIDHSPIAVIDDDEDVLESFRFWFKVEGIPLTTYLSAIAYLADAPASPCGLIVDQNMPGMTGISLVARLRALGAVTPALLITSALSDALIAQAAKVGIEQVAEKPPSEEVVLAFVELCRKQSEGARG
jgi:FixJ family two-component response regulator